MLQIDKYSRIPIYEQVIKEIERLILCGLLEADSVLPSVRNLSQELNVNPNTLQKAYMELERRGLCYSVPGSGRYISRDARNILTEIKKEGLQTIARLTEELIGAGISMVEIMQCVKAAGREAYAKQILK